MNESEPPLEASLKGVEVETVAYAKRRDKVHRLPDCWVSGLRRKGGMTFTWAAADNSGNHRTGCQSKGARRQTPRLIVETPVHGAEQSVRAKKAGNAAGAKGLRQHRQFVVNLQGDEP